MESDGIGVAWTALEQLPTCVSKPLWCRSGSWRNSCGMEHEPLVLGKKRPILHGFTGVVSWGKAPS